MLRDLRSLIMPRHEREFKKVRCILEDTGRVHMSQEDVDYMCDIKQADNLVYTPTTLVSPAVKMHRERCPGYFGDTLEQLIEKIDDCEEELLYDILDYSETYRYVSCKSHKCYALFLPSVYLELFIKNFYEVNYE